MLRRLLCYIKGRVGQSHLLDLVGDLLQDWDLDLGLVLLVEDVLVLTHLHGLLHAELLALLIPAPLVYLGFSETRLLGYQVKSLLRPVWI